LLPTLKQRIESRRNIAKVGAISQDSVLQVQQEYFNNLTQLSNLKVQLKQLDYQQTQSQLEYQQNLNRINDITNQIQEVATNETKLTQTDKERALDKNNQVRETKQRIAQLKLRLSNQSDVVSQYNGRVLEVGTVIGRTVSNGTRLGTIEIEDSKAPLLTLTYFADKDGKQIKPGMTLEVTPSVVKRERFGGIVAKVTEVSPFPVATQDIAAIIGNEDVAKSFAESFSQRGGVAVQVYAQMQNKQSNISGYEWSSSKGPDLKLSSGTTTSVRVKIGERSPISYIIPIFRSWTGVY
jgi:HlyD family secretion protein